MFKDLRHAVRLLWQSRGWTAVVVLSLALGIGANTAIFSAVNARLLTSLPVQNPEELVRFRYAGRNDMVTSSSGYGFLNKTPDGRDVRATFSYPMYQQFVADNRSMTDLLACAPFGRVNVFVDGQSEIANAFISSGNYYRMLGVAARIGRTILPEDDRPGATPVAVISSKYWHSRFGTDAAVVGKVIKVNNVPVTIVGVIPPHFSGIQQPVASPPDISLPLALDPQLSTNTGSGPPRVSQATYWWLQVMGRLKPGMTAAQAQGNLEGVFQQTARSGLEGYLKSLSDEERAQSSNRSRMEVPSLLVEPGGRGFYDISTNEFRSVALLAVVVALVLLIVCANVANLLLSRATTRQKELSVRLSLGATRGRLVRQLLTESLLLAALGGSLGVVVGYWGKQLLPGAADVPRPFDWRVLTFVFAVSGLTGLIFGILPALRGTGMNVNSALKETSRGVVGSRSWASKILLAVQVAISLVLLVGAGLFLRTLTNLRHVDIGFNPQNLLLFRVNPQLNRYDEKRTLAFYGEMLDRLRAVPGVSAVALSAPALLSGSVNGTSIFVHGRAYVPDARDRDNNINRLVVSPNFFDVMGIPVLSGRGFDDRDSDTSPKVVMINQAAARKYFANEDPVGQRFGSSLETAGQLEVVGIVRDVKYDSVRDAAPPTMFVPYTQTRVGNAVFEVRTRSAPAAITGAVREAVRQIDQNLPVMDVSTQLEQVEMRFQQERFFAQAYTTFGIVALLLAALGLFGVMSYNVARRTNEIGIRMALGAQRADVLRLVMRESMILVIVGVLAGLALALFASRFVATLLYGVPPTDLLALAVAILVMLAVSAVAGYIPARRASRVDPMVALHYE
jgi:predicted permease